MQARDLARTPLEIDAAVTVALAWKRAVRARGSAVVVRDGSRIVGGVSRGDLRRAIHHGLGGRAVRELLLGGAVRVAPGTDLARVRREIVRRGASLAVLVGRDGGVVGAIEPAALPAPDPSADARRLVRRLAPRLETWLGVESLRLVGRIERAARRHGLRAFLVGGFVRDALLGRPTRDVDLLVDGDLALVLRPLGMRVERHAEFLSASTFAADGGRIDIGQARRERYSRAGALPQVRPASVLADLRRRDFTVNSLAVGLEARGLGELLDPCGALADLRARRLRVLHPLAFVEDPTRVLRGARLATRLGFAFDRGSRRALRLARSSGVLERLSGARLRSEVVRVLTDPRAERTVRTLARGGLLAEMLPGLRATPSALAALRRAARRPPRGPSQVHGWLVGLAVLARGSEPATLEELARRLGLERGARAVLRGAATALDEVRRTLSTRRGLAPSAIWRACRGLPPELLVAAAVLDGGRRSARRLDRYLERDRQAALDIGGHDLLGAGIAPGPQIARGLEAALAAKIDGRAPTTARQLQTALAAARRSRA